MNTIKIIAARIVFCVLSMHVAQAQSSEDLTRECLNLHLEERYSEASAVCRKSAESGFIVGAWLLGDILLNGKAGNQSPQEGAKWISIAAEGGIPDAQSSMAILYDTGNGVKENKLEAFKWHSLAAEQGHSGSQFMLGLAYAAGRGTVKSYHHSYVWLSVSAASGNKDAAEMRDKLEELIPSSTVISAQNEAVSILKRIQSKTKN